MDLNEFRCFGDFKIFDVVEVLFWRIITSTLGHVICLLEIYHVAHFTRVLTVAHEQTVLC